MSDLFIDATPSPRARMFDQAAVALTHAGRHDLAAEAVRAAGRLDNRITFELTDMQVPIDGAQPILASVRIDAHDGTPSDGAPIPLPFDAEIARLREELTEAVLRQAVALAEEGLSMAILAAQTHDT